MIQSSSTRASHWLTSQPETIILQPTTLCPLDCDYCYLSTRHRKQDMTPDVAAAVAAAFEPDWTPIEIVWHGGEPLAVGATRFAELLTPFEPLRRAGRLRHKVQTGATLITSRWCELFEQYGIGVGVSIDGPRELNRRRVDRGGRPIFDRTMTGIENLRTHGLPFIVLAVVGHDGIDHAAEILDFLRGLGTRWIGINIEAKEGANSSGDTPTREQAIRFWRDAFTWASHNPHVTLREFDRLLGFLRLTPYHRDADAHHDLIPTIGWNGDIVVLSPELLGVHDEHHQDFVVGNVLADPLPAILARAPTTPYVQQFLTGLQNCKTDCEFFTYCQGAHAGDRYFEHGTFTATETDHCRGSVQAPVLALSDLITNQAREGIPR